jgi:hypothetical protein
LSSLGHGTTQQRCARHTGGQAEKISAIGAHGRTKYNIMVEREKASS